MRVISNAVDIHDVRGRGRENVMHPWFHDKGHPLVGRFAKQTNQRLLLEALAQLRDSI